MAGVHRTPAGVRFPLPSPSVLPPANLGQLASPRPTWTGPWQPQQQRAPAPCGLAGPASLASIGGLQCAPSGPILAEWTPTTSARTFAGTGCRPERRATLAPGRSWRHPPTPRRGPSVVCLALPGYLERREFARCGMTWMAGAMGSAAFRGIEPSLPDTLSWACGHTAARCGAKKS